MKPKASKSLTEKELKVVKQLSISHQEHGQFGYTDVSVEGFTKMQVGAYVTILSNKGYITILAKEKGVAQRKFVFTDKIKSVLENMSE